MERRMSKASGYNNAAFCRELDPSLYDYEYVPEIDPDSPDLQRRGSYRRTRHVAPRGQLLGPRSAPLNTSGSSSDGSVIVEERNNRRVTLICEKRRPQMVVVADADGGYSQDISLESDSNNEEVSHLTRTGTVRERRSHNQTSNQHHNQHKQDGRPHIRRPTVTVRHTFHRYEELDPNTRGHRYAEIDDQDSAQDERRHRYEQIDDQDSAQDERRHRYEQIDQQLQTEGVHFVRKKPRAPSPVCHSSPSSGFSDFNESHFRRTSSPFDEANSFEMCDLSNSDCNQRQPPVGASATHVSELPPRVRDQAKDREREHLLKSPTREREHLLKSPSSERQHLLKSPTREREHLLKSPTREREHLLKSPSSEREHLLTPRNSPQVPKIINSHSCKPYKQSVRRNLSNSYVEHCGSPYRATTVAAISPRITHTFTPIGQRKFAGLTTPLEPRPFERMSRMFQSSSNIRQTDPSHSHRSHPLAQPQNNLNLPASPMKRNQSVPNFQQHFERKTPTKVREERQEAADNYRRNVQFSPLPLSPDKLWPLCQSRLSLLQMSNSRMAADEDKSESSYRAESGSGRGCILLAAVVQLLAGVVTCAICFYLMSKVGRRYYLDLGTIAGFVTTVLGALGFRSSRWRWLPNRNYVTGYTAVAGFGLVNACAVVMLLLTKPSARDPILDVCAGAISAISVIVFCLAVTGLTMSGCCSQPPHDNRVTVM